MPRIALDNLVGPANRLRSVIADADETINFIVESTAPGDAKVPAYLRGTPGLVPFVILPTSHVRGLFEINGRVFAVGGAVFYEINADGTATAYGSVANDNQPVSMDSNGTAGFQVCIIAGGQGYIFSLSTNTLAQITDPDFPENARMVTYIGGYFVVMQGRGSRSFSWSTRFDGLDWDVLDVAEVSETAGAITGILRNHFELWIVGGSETEVYVLSGDPNNVFAPYQGVLIEIGTIARFSIQRVDNSLMWLTSDARGIGMVVRMDQFVPRKVSSFAVDYDLQQALTLALPYAIGLAFQMDGHIFYALMFRQDSDVDTELDHCWLYDLTMDRWTKWAHWNANTATWEPHRGSCYTTSVLFGVHLMGDRLSGAIYRMSFDITDEELVDP
jgi:hypothetical protein